MNSLFCKACSVLLLLVALTSTGHTDLRAQSPLFSMLAAGDENARMFHFYPGTIRAITKVAFGEEASKSSFSTLKRARLIYTPGSNAVFAAKKKEFFEKKDREGFETLAEMHNAGTSVSVMKNNADRPLSVIFVSDGEAHYAIELEGELTREMIMQLMMADMEALRGQFNFGGKKSPEGTLSAPPQNPEKYE